MNYLNKATTSSLLALLLASCSLLLLFQLHGPEVALSIFFILSTTLLLFYVFRLLLIDPMISILLVLLSFVILSFFGSYQKVLSYLLLSGTPILFLYKRKELFSLLHLDGNKLLDLGLFNIFSWGLLFNLVLFNGIYSDKGFTAIDLFHPIYEYSIGLGYSQSIFDPPDLSYAGNVVRYHFLSTPMPLMWENLFGISLFHAIYIVTPIFILTLICITTNIFFNSFKHLKTPILILFFIPVFVVTSDVFINVFRYSILQSTSFALGSLLILISAHLLYHKRYAFLFLAGIILAITKVSFFMVLLGGIFLFHCKNRLYRKAFVHSGILFVSFLGLYGIFLSGAQSHNYWIVFPNDLFFLFVRGDPLALISLFVNLGVIYAYFKNNDTTITLLLSFCLSGVIGYILLTETADRNSLQFIKATTFFMSILIWYLLKNIYISIPSRSWKMTYLSLFLVSFSFPIYETLKGPFNTYVDYRRIENGARDLFRIKENGGYLQYGFSQDFIRGYQFLNANSLENSVILYGKQYDDKTKSIEWWPSTGFIRSALSRRQMYVENYKYKGVGMEPDFPERLSKSIHFYKHFVDIQEFSKNKLTFFYNDRFGESEGQPLSKRSKSSNNRSDISNRIIYFLGLKKEWSWSNRPERIKFETKTLLQGYDISDKWALEFLKKARITHIVLEMNDQPSSLLVKITKQIYKSGGITILEIRDNISNEVTHNIE